MTSIHTFIDLMRRINVPLNKIDEKKEKQTREKRPKNKTRRHSFLFIYFEVIMVMNSKQVNIEEEQEKKVLFAKDRFSSYPRNQLVHIEYQR